MQMKSWTGVGRRFWLSIALAVAIGGPLAMPAHGQFLTLEFYLSIREQAKAKPTTALSETVLLEGVIDGIETMAAANSAAGIKPVFCPPKDFKMSPNDLAKAIDLALARNPTLFVETDGIGVIAIFVLDERFPCK